jgi:hypothetical protein
MTINYAGSAGGQPRLFIPSMGQFQDPAVQTAMQQILQWANTLMLGTGGLIAAASFEATGLDTWNSFSSPTFSYQAAIEWSAIAGEVGTWVYLQSDNETFNFPDDSITIVTGALSLDYSGNAASTAGVASADGSVAAWASIPNNTATPFDITFPLTGLITPDSLSGIGGNDVFYLQDIINGPTVTLNTPYSILSLASFGAP